MGGERGTAFGGVTEVDGDDITLYPLYVGEGGGSGFIWWWREVVLWSSRGGRRVEGEAVCSRSTVPPPHPIFPPDQDPNSVTPSSPSLSSFVIILYCHSPTPPSMQLQEWLRSLRSGGGVRLPEAEELRSLLPSLPYSSSFSLSSLSLSPSSLLGLGALASLTAYWLVTRPRPIRPPCDLHSQSIPVQGDPSCRRSALLKDETLLEFYYEDTRTAYDMFQRGLRVAGQSASCPLRHSARCCPE
ncbi:hypothetical protein JZ751_001454 [Albula glossodonta]|uniref:Uncharacterized protein n=1 Tax=Albula glossodonta TaxID=121402 RepID=A0A8T2PTU0_9TELE|nr:hypothetical protein JZ751_001454 [Albula glossodonta]